MRLLSRPSFAALFVLLAITAGCATPQFQTNVRLIPPADAQGRACVQACEARKTGCQTDCQARYRACEQSLEPQVEAHYTAAMKRYEIELKHYASALRHYEMQLRFEWIQSSRFRHPYWLDPWHMGVSPPPYPEPVMPTREQARAALVRTSCQADCGCLPAYDACFVGCGGERITETICVKNCPPAK